MTLRLNLGQYLQQHGISAYRLVQEVEGRVAPNTVYALARKPAQRIDLKTVHELLQALGRVQGERVQITDMLEDLPEPDLSHLQLPGRVAAPTFDKKFRFSGAAGRITVKGGPTIDEIVSEGREP